MKTYLIASLAAFVLSAAFTRLLLPVLKKLKAGQNILCYVKEHAKKAGTPTMGGLAFISAAFICACLFVKEPDGKFIVTLSLGLAYAAVGFLDDLLKIRRKDNLGLKAYQKIIFQGAAAILAGRFQNIALAAQIDKRRCNDLFADCVDRRIGHLCEQLLKIVIQQLRLF